MKIVEVIATRPRSMAYFTNRAKDLRRLDALFNQAGKLLYEAQQARFPDYDIDKIFNAQYRDSETYEYSQTHPVTTNEIVGLSHTLQYQYDAFGGSLADALETIVKFGEKDFFKYIPPALQNVLEKTQAIAHILDNIPPYEQLRGLIEQDQNWELLNPEYHEPEEVQSVENYLEAIRILGPAWKQYQLVIRDLSEKVAAQQEIQTARGSSDPHKWRPRHEEVETLYHATAHADEIAQYGFSAEKPLDRQGVGNFGNQNSISFTHDIKIAMDIVRCLKELTMIANGQLKAQTIADWIRRENIPNFRWYEHGAKYIDTPGFGKTLSPDRIPFTSFNIEQTAYLYNQYIWKSAIHPNPVFANLNDLVNSLVGRSVRNIGILACQVRLGPHAETEIRSGKQPPGTATYHHGESEFRVPVESVLSVKRVM